MGKSGMTSREIEDLNYKEQLDDGQKFEEHVYRCLEKEWGFLIKGHKSQFMQFKVGENQFGMEIKYDKKSKRTPNLYIETHEKKYSTNKDWIPSGIYRSDNSWLFLNGVYEKFYIFSIKTLRELERNLNDRLRRETLTSKGFLLSKEIAKELAINIIDVKEEMICTLPDILQKQEWMDRF